jgi:hypothetical protein
MCLLLHTFGVTAVNDHLGRSPLQYACWTGNSTNVLEVSRALLLMGDEIGNDFLDMRSWVRDNNGRTPEYFRWLWDQIADVYDGDDIFDARIKFIREMVRHSVEVKMPDIQPWLKIGAVIQLIESGSCGLINYIWYPERRWGGKPESSYEEGNKIIKVLKALGVDIRTWLSQELNSIKGGLLTSWTEPSVKIVASCIEQEQDLWDLHCEWTWDIEPRSHAYEVLSCYSNLAGPQIWTFDYSNRKFFPESDETYLENGQNWPYWWPWSLQSEHYQTRFQRRQAKYARKERVRAGQKQPRIRAHMPGAWTFG